MPAKSVRLGIAPIAWSNDDLPQLGGDTPLETCLAEAHQAGFAGIELGHKFPRDAALLRPGNSPCATSTRNSKSSGRRTGAP